MQRENRQGNNWKCPNLKKCSLRKEVVKAGENQLTLILKTKNLNHIANWPIIRLNSLEVKSKETVRVIWVSKS